MNANKEYNIVYSIGIRCHTEMILKKLDLVKFSSIFGSLNIKSFNNIISSINSNFDTLINENNLVFTKNIDNMAILNSQYGNRTLNKLYDDINDYHSSTIAHHDLSTEKDKDHFKRGVVRFNYIKYMKFPILFICIIHYSENITINEEMCNELINAFKNNGWTNFHILFIYFTNKDDLHIHNIFQNEVASLYYVNYSGYDASNLRESLFKNIIDKFNIINLKTIDEVTQTI